MLHQLLLKIVCIICASVQEPLRACVSLVLGQWINPKFGYFFRKAEIKRGEFNHYIRYTYIGLTGFSGKRI